LQVRILPGEPVLDCHPQFGKPANHGWRAAREGADSRLAGDKVYRLSTPVTEELDPVPHGRGGRGCAKMEQAAQLLANREPLLRRQNHAGMLASGTDPLRVNVPRLGFSVRPASITVTTVTPRERRAVTRRLCIASSSK